MGLTDLLDNSALLYGLCATVLVLLFCVAAGVSRRANQALITPVTVFFGFTLIHILAGYPLAFVASDQIGRTGLAMEPFYNKSLLLLTIGVASMFIGFVVFPCRMGEGAQSLILRFATSITEEQLARRARFWVALSVLLTAIGLAGLGSIPLFMNPGHRYADVFKPAYGWVGFTVNRGRDLVQLPAAILLLLLLKGRNKLLNLTFVSIALVTSVVTATRTAIVDVVLIVALVVLLRRQTTAFMLTGTVILFGYIGTQLLLAKDAVESSDSLVAGAGAALPELRDFANVIMRDPARSWGLTFVVAALPVPGFVSDFTSTYLLRTITLNAVGIPLDAEHGGLRVTYMGEWYLNFGVPGVICGGLLVGILYSWIEGLLTLASASNDVRLEIFAGSIWMLLSFELYLCGTGVAGMIKVMLLVLLLLFIKLRPYPEPEYCPV